MALSQYWDNINLHQASHDRVVKIVTHLVAVVVVVVVVVVVRFFNNHYDKRIVNKVSIQCKQQCQRKI